LSVSAGGRACTGRDGALCEVVGIKRLQLGSASEDRESYYGLSLIAAVAATIASLALAWARNGAIADLLDGVLDHVRSLFGMG
jgi:hypothetical protein